MWQYASVCGVVEIWARGSRGWKREQAEETRNFCLTRSSSDLGIKRAVLFSGFAICVAVVEVRREGSRGSRGEGVSFCLGWFSSFVLFRRSGCGGVGGSA